MTWNIFSRDEAIMLTLTLFENGIVTIFETDGAKNMPIQMYR